MNYENTTKIAEMEEFVEEQTELNFNITSKGKTYFVIMQSLLKEILNNNVKKVEAFLEENMPNAYSSFASKEDLSRFVIDELPSAPLSVKKNFKTELKNIQKCLGYIQFVNEKLIDPHLDAPSEESLLLKEVFDVSEEDLAHNF